MKDGQERKPGQSSRRIQKVTREEQGDLLADAVTGLFPQEDERGTLEAPGEESGAFEAPAPEAGAGEAASDERVSGQMEPEGPTPRRSPETEVGPSAGSLPPVEERGVTEAIPEAPWERKMAWAKERAREGRLEEAEELYRELVEEDPTNVRALNNLGILLDEMGNAEGAVEQLRTARRIDPQNLEVLGNLGAALAALGKYGEAEEELRHAFRMDPTNLEIRANLGILLFRRGLYHQAAAELETVCAAKPDDGLPLYYRGEALNRLGRVDEAIEALERVIELIPGNHKAYYTLGVLFDKKNLPEKAAVMYRKARRLSPP